MSTTTIIRRSAPKVLNIKGLSAQKMPLGVISGVTIRAVLGGFTPKYEHSSTLLHCFRVLFG